MRTSNAVRTDTANNEWQESTCLHTQGQGPTGQPAGKVANIVTSALLASLATAPAGEYNKLEYFTDVRDASRHLSFSYRPENKLNEKLEHTIGKLQQFVFEYIARVVSVDRTARTATLETTVDGEQTYFDLEIGNFSFPINKFSSVKIFGYQNYKGVEKVKFLEMPDDDFDEATLKKLEDLRYVKNSRP